MVRGFLLLPLIFAYSCSSWLAQSPSKIKRAFQKGDYAQALALLEADKAYAEEKNRLLYHLEKGAILLRQKDHTPSSLSFKRAKDVLEELYTTRLSKKALALVSNDNADIYHGENYEISLLHLYSAANFYALYQNDGGRENLFRARAEMVAWNSFLERLQPTEAFRNDMAAKLFGAVVHEEVGTSAERQIALQLYKDAYSLLKEKYGGYPSFQSSPELADGLARYIRRHILRLTKALRPFEIKKTRKRFAIAEGIEATANSNLVVLLERGAIADKRAQRQYFSLGHVLEDPDSSAAQKITAAVGAVVLMGFAADKLGLLPPPTTWNPPGHHLGFNTAAHLVMGTAISFELPIVEDSPESPAPRLIVKTKQGEVVYEEALALAAPLDDTARGSFEERASLLYAKTGLRVALKHLGAIAASYTTYSLLKGKNRDNDFLAANAAVIQYMAAAHVIAESEKADLRQWTTLPKSVWILDTFVPEGDYQVFIADGSTNHYAGDVSLKDERTRTFLPINI